MFIPAYLKLSESELRAKVEQSVATLESCKVCPRDCNVNRLEDKTAVCKTGRLAQVASHFAHFGEEDCLRGRNGSGTIFFNMCNLRCVFCQNYDISQANRGPEVGVGEKNYEEINRYITRDEYDDAVSIAHEEGLHRLDPRPARIRN